MSKLDGMAAMAIAMRMKGQWRKLPGEKDTEHVKRIYEIFASETQLIPSPVQIHGQSVEGVISGMIDSMHVHDDNTLRYLFNCVMMLTTSLATEMAKRGMKVDA